MIIKNLFFQIWKFTKNEFDIKLGAKCYELCDIMLDWYELWLIGMLFYFIYDNLVLHCHDI